MTDWKTKLMAVVRCASNGDPAPLKIVCDALAAMERDLAVLKTPKVAPPVVKEIKVRPEL